MSSSEARSFDIIVVGGGTAGCVIASRLSENTSLRVLLLEAGPDNNNDPRLLTPLRSREMFGNPAFDWDYRTSPQEFANNRIFLHTRGRMLGGSSAINSHSLVFPNKAMHDAWAKIAGDQKWSWEQMHSYYQKFHTVQPRSDGTESKDHDHSKEPSRNGPIQASYPRSENELQTAWEDAFKSLNWFCPHDGVNGQAIGAVTTTNAIDGRAGKGERSHAGHAYLTKARASNNLVVETGARIEKNALDRLDSSGSDELRATGVYYHRNGTTVFAKAEKEVVLCAGTFGSPQTLELSGVGDQNILRQAGITCHLHSPNVGENLQDHYNFGPSVEVNSDIETIDEMIRQPAKAREEYETNRTGMLSEGAAYSFAYWPLQMLSTPAEEEALRQSLGFLDKAPEGAPLTKAQFDYNRKMLLEPKEASATVFTARANRFSRYDDDKTGNYLSVAAMLSHPFSKGSSHVSTSDPSQHPRINCNYLSHPLDIDVLRHHVIQINRLLALPAFTGVLKPGGKISPPELGSSKGGPKDLDHIIRQYGATNYHPCGTCVMASADLGGVVDENLYVRGTSNLRVCDASVFPIIPRGNILSSVYAVAEKGAELIYTKYRSPKLP